MVSTTSMFLFSLPPADVVSFSHSAFGQHRAHRVAVIGDENPVAHILPVAVHGQGLAGPGIQEHERNQFFRKLVRPVVIGAIGGQSRQAVSVVISAHQMVRTGLGGGIRAVGRIRRGLAKGRIVRAQRTVHFVGRYMKKAE